MRGRHEPGSSRLGGGVDSGKIKECLRAEGIEFEEMAKTGVCAIIHGELPGATIAIRADMVD